MPLLNGRFDPEKFNAVTLANAMQDNLDKEENGLDFAQSIIDTLVEEKILSTEPIAPTLYTSDYSLLKEAIDKLEYVAKELRACVILLLADEGRRQPIGPYNSASNK